MEASAVILFSQFLFLVLLSHQFYPGSHQIAQDGRTPPPKCLCGPGGMCLLVSLLAGEPQESWKHEII